MQIMNAGIIGLDKIVGADSVSADLLAAAPTVIGAGLGLSVAFFGAKYLWGKLRGLAS